MLLAIAAAYVTAIVLLAALFEGSCQESYPARCPVLDLQPAALTVTALLIVGIAVLAAVCAGRRRSAARAALLVALTTGAIAIIVIGAGLSLNSAWETRF